MEPNSQEIRKKLLGDFEAGRLSFFLGAGASVAGGLPIAKDVVKEVVTAFLHDISQPALDARLKEGGLLDRLVDPVTIKALRLEVLLGAIDSRQLSEQSPNFYAAQIAERITARGKPSNLHRFLAAGLARGQIPSILTTNWDCLIEESLSSANSIHVAWEPDSFATAPGTRVLAKLHGTVALKDDDSVTKQKKQASLVTDVFGLGGELSTEVNDVVSHYFCFRESSICVVGYSARDPDVNFVLRGSVSHFFWVLFQPKLEDAETKARIEKLMPRAKVSFMYLDELMEALSLKEKSEPPTIEINSKMSPVTGLSQRPIVENVSACTRLIALGVALGHAACGDLALKCFAAAVMTEPQNALARYHLAREHAVMYRSWRSLAMFLKPTPRLRESADPVSRYERSFYSLLALENISILRWRLTPLGQTLSALALTSVGFGKMERIARELKSGSGPSWLRSKNGEMWYRLIARYIHFSLTSARVQWYLPPKLITRRLLTALKYAKESRSPSLQGQVLRSLGRWYGLHGKSEKSRDSYDRAVDQFKIISDHNGVTEVKKYKFKTLLTQTLDDKVVVALDTLTRELAEEYPAQRGMLPAYVRSFLVWRDSQGWKKSLAGITVRCWHWLMQARWGF